MCKLVTVLIIFIGVFAPTAKALVCPKKLEIEISNMDFAEPGSAFDFATEFKTVSPAAKKSSARAARVRFINVEIFRRVLKFAGPYREIAALQIVHIAMQHCTMMEADFGRT